MGPLQITATHEHRYHDQHLDLDFEHKTALQDTKPLRLTRKEYAILALLIQNAGEVVHPRNAAVARVGLQQPDPYADAGRAHPPAAQEAGRAQRHLYRDHLQRGVNQSAPRSHCSECSMSQKNMARQPCPIANSGNTEH